MSMRSIAAAGISLLLLAAAGCSSQEQRHEAAGSALKAALEGAGLSKVTFQSVSGDGDIVVRGVSADAGGGVSVAIKEIRLRSPDLDPMLVDWHDVGKIEIRDWVIYEGYEPKPEGFRATALEATDITLALEGQPLRVEAASFRLDGFDSTRPGALRYEGYRVKDAVVFHEGLEAARLAEVKVKAGRWLDGVAMPLMTDGHVQGTVSVAVASTGAASFLPAFLQPSIGFTATSASEIDVKSGRFSMSQSLEAEGFGSFVSELEAGGVDRGLIESLDAMAKARKPARKGKGAGKAESNDGKAMQELATAAAGLSLISYRLEGSGLEWLGSVFDELSGGDRESIADLVVRFMDTGFAGREKSERANRSLAGMALFIANPGSFELRLEPGEPFVFASKGLMYYINPASGPLDALGFEFKNAPR